MGSDPICYTVADFCRISIHAPRMGSDESGNGMASLARRFQSTLPAWGATNKTRYLTKKFLAFQSTLPAWGATDGDFDPRFPLHISIHAPRMGSDQAGRWYF